MILPKKGKYWVWSLIIPALTGSHSVKSAVRMKPQAMDKDEMKMTQGRVSTKHRIAWKWKRYKQARSGNDASCVSACIDFGARLGRTDRWRHSIEWGSQNILMTWYMISSQLKSAKNCDFQGSITDLYRQTNRPTNGHTDRWTDPLIKES